MRGGIANSIITGSIIITLVVSIASSAGIVYGLLQKSNAFDTYPVIGQDFWFSYGKTTTTVSPNPDMFHFSGILGLIIACAASVILLKFQYKKSGSTEIFFFALFLASLSFEGLRYTSFIFYTAEIPSFLHTIITRIIYFGRFMSIFFLLCSSLYACEIRYHKFMNLSGLVVVLSFAIAYLISLDGSRFMSTFLYRLNDELGIFLIISTTSLFSIINFVIAAIKRDFRFLYVAFACLLIVTGQEILYFSGNFITIIALASIVIGIIVYYREIDKIYLLT